MTVHDDEKLEEALEETFPASDPSASTVETGIRVDAGASAADGPAPAGTTAQLVVRDNREANRFEVIVDGEVAFLTYQRRSDAFVLVHTEVPESFRGRGIASQLAKFGLQSARGEGVPVIVRCPFVRAYLRRHPHEGPPS